MYLLSSSAEERVKVSVWDGGGEILSLCPRNISSPSCLTELFPVHTDFAYFASEKSASSRSHVSRRDRFDPGLRALGM